MINKKQLQKEICNAFARRNEWVDMRKNEYYATVATEILIRKVRYYMILLTIAVLGVSIVAVYATLTAILWRTM
jgi:hypothetical protein